jgi:hypothetical protein
MGNFHWQGVLFVLHIKGLMSQYGGFHEIFARTVSSDALQYIALPWATS